MKRRRQSARRLVAGSLAAGLAIAALGGPGARADEQDAEQRDSLIALLMVEESAKVCNFIIDDKARQQLVAARGALADKLLLDGAELDKLRANLDRQFEADRGAYCAADGPWKKAVDETILHMPGL
jgi:hypothetical protein